MYKKRDDDDDNDDDNNDNDDDTIYCAGAEVRGRRRVKNSSHKQVCILHVEINT